MNPSKLQLDQYYFPHQEVRANPNHDPSTSKKVGSVKFHVHCGKLPSGTHQHYAEIVAEADEVSGINSAYFFRIQAFGLFTADDSLTLDEAKALVSIYGVQVLLGAIRDHLVSLTSRGPWGSFYLNIITLQTQPELNP